MELFTFYEAWHYLKSHPMFNDNFEDCLDIEVVKINPKTKEIDFENNELNTLTEIWLEIGPYIKDGFAHDIDLDCGGYSFEEAIINLAKLVKQYYPENLDDLRKIISEKYGEEQCVI